STLSKARIIDKSKMDVNKIMILSSVKVKNLNTKQLAKFLLVSENEADIKSGKISVSSPIGKGLLGKMVGEIAEISVPAGIIKFEIIEISVGLE
ncbi:MAG: GreA/GreB family elongation factor, partial [Bacteroidota bacterium]